MVHRTGKGRMLEVEVAQLLHLQQSRADNKKQNLQGSSLLQTKLNASAHQFMYTTQSPLFFLTTLNQWPREIML
jgi:hypothetical protein